MLCGLLGDIDPMAELLPIRPSSTTTSGIRYLKTLLAIKHLISVSRANIGNNIITAKRNFSFF